MEEHMDRTAEDYLQDRGSEEDKQEQTAGKEPEQSEKEAKKSRKEQRKAEKEAKKRFWNSRTFQNAACITGVLAMTLSVVGMLLMLSAINTDEELYGYGVWDVVEETMTTLDYTDSWLYADTYMEEAGALATEAHARQIFETDGKFDENKTIDLAYVSMRREGVAATGITYRVGDLLSWRGGLVQTLWLIQPQVDAILEKKKEDPGAYTSQTELNEIIMAANTGTMGQHPVRKCVVVEDAFPTDGDSLYTHAGDLNTLALYTEYLEELLSFVRGMYDRYAGQSIPESNIGIAVVNPTIGLLYLNFEDYDGMTSGSVQELSEALYDYVSQKEYHAVHHYGTGTILTGKTGISLDEERLGGWIGLCEGDRLYLTLDAALSKDDPLSRMEIWYMRIKELTTVIFAVFGIGLILFLTAFVRRTTLEGRDEDRKPRLIDRWFTILLPAVSIPIVAASYFLMEAMEVLTEWYYSYYEIGNEVGIYMSGGGMIALSMLAVSVLFSVGLYCYLELVRRIKERTLYKKSLLHFMICLLKKVFGWLTEKVKNLLKLIDGKIKWVIGYLAFLIINLIAVAFAVEDTPVPMILMAMADLVIGAAFIAYFKEQDILRKHMTTTVQGSREKPLEEERFHGGNQRMAQLINDMDEGISRAVEKSIKDERMRTELIANVSHDIRTPLTSIINYVDLLKKEQMPSENAQKYLEVLDEKSARLKQLTEDLVEASRITSGNVSVTEMRLSGTELVQQIVAEYEEKFKERELTLVLNLPEEGTDDSFIGDSRYVWRVLSNLFSNLYKYAMPHTRVYLSMYRTPVPMFCMELKNISEYPLNISPEELTERFVRGDLSRGTEGNGLGLSIAQSLMNAMHGSLEIVIDGDLYKVILNFPVPVC